MTAESAGEPRLRAVLESFEHATAIFDRVGRCCLTNPLMRARGVSVGLPLDQAEARLTSEGRRFVPWYGEGATEDSVELHLPHAGWVEIVKSSVEGGFVQLTARTDLEARRREKAVSVLLGDRGGQDLFTLGANALATALGYRWAGVARFRKEMREVELLGFWGDGKPLDVFTYDIADKPCRAVAAGTGFTMFPAHVASLFPGEEWLAENRAESYVGQVYFGPDGRPWGHVLAIHDAPDVATAATRRMVALIASMVGADLQSAHLALKMEEIEREASTDPLTLLANRRGFDRVIEARFESIDRGDLLDVAIVCIDLDGFKSVNDQLGHAEGDRLLRLFADGLQALVRQSDGVFRIGGDEFALVLGDASSTAVGRVEAGVEALVGRLRAEGFERIGASTGHATLREVGLNADAAMEAADRRMYEAKRMKGRGRREQS